MILIALLSPPGGSPAGVGFDFYDFSFSGLKTAVLREVERWRQQGEWELPVADLAARRPWAGFW